MLLRLGEHRLAVVLLWELSQFVQRLSQDREGWDRLAGVPGALPPVQVQVAAGRGRDLERLRWSRAVV